MSLLPSPPRGLPKSNSHKARQNLQRSSSSSSSTSSFFTAMVSPPTSVLSQEYFTPPLTSANIAADSPNTSHASTIFDAEYYFNTAPLVLTAPLVRSTTPTCRKEQERNAKTKERVAAYHAQLADHHANEVQACAQAITSGPCVVQRRSRAMFLQLGMEKIVGNVRDHTAVGKKDTLLAAEQRRYLAEKERRREEVVRVVEGDVLLDVERMRYMKARAERNDLIEEANGINRVRFLDEGAVDDLREKLYELEGEYTKSVIERYT